MSTLPLVVLLCAAPASGQVYAQGQPPRDARALPATGTGAIKGRVVDAATGSGVARARVRLGGVTSKTMVTDAEGRFVFADLPAGTWTLSATKPGYLAGRYPEPGRTLRSISRAMTLTAGEILEGIEVPLHGAGAIAGRVLDAHGDPLDAVEVRLLRQPPGAPTAVAATATSANDIGEFRFGRLQPGRYLLVAQPRVPPDDEEGNAQPVATFYPGATAPAGAQVITLERGQTITGLDWLVSESTPTTIEGTVLNAAGEPQSSGYVTYRASAHRVPGWAGGGRSLGAGGTFRLKVAPGEYVLDARIELRRPNGEYRAEDQQIGTANVTATGGTVSGVTIVVSPPGSISGRLVFDGSMPLPADANQMRSWALGGRDGECRTGRSDVAQKGSEWTFTITGVSGMCEFTAFDGPAGWTIRSITLGDRDLLDHPFPVKPGQTIPDVKITYTDRRTALRLQVADEAGRPTAEYAALVFSTDKQHWSLPASRRVRPFAPPPQAAGREGRGTLPVSPVIGIPLPEPGGRAIIDMPEGEYFVAALDDIPVETARDPAVLEELIRHATRVTLTEGMTTDVNVRRVVRRQE